MSLTLWLLAASLLFPAAAHSLPPRDQPIDPRDSNIWQPREETPPPDWHLKTEDVLRDDGPHDWRNDQPCEVVTGPKCYPIPDDEKSAIQRERERREKNRLYRDVERHGSRALPDRAR